MDYFLLLSISSSSSIINPNATSGILLQPFGHAVTCLTWSQVSQGHEMTVLNCTLALVAIELNVTVAFLGMGEHN